MQNLINIKHAVLLRTYNRPDKLDNCLSSLVTQSFKDFNVYIIDDCSINNLEKILSKYDNYLNLFYYRTPCRLQYGAKTFNYGLSKLKNEIYISILDDDDIWHKDKLYIINKKFLDNHQWISHYYEIKSSFKDDRDFTFKQIPIKDKNIFYKTSAHFGAPSFHSFHLNLLNKFGHWDELLFKGPCQEFFFRLSTNRVKLEIIEENLGIYKIDPNSITFNNKNKNTELEIISRAYINYKYKNYMNLYIIIKSSYTSSNLINKNVINIFKTVLNLFTEKKMFKYKIILLKNIYFYLYVFFLIFFTFINKFRKF